MLLLKKDDEDDFDGTVRSRNHKVVEIKVLKEVVRALIGRNGKNIKGIQEQSNTKINFRDFDEVYKVCLVFFVPIQMAFKDRIQDTLPGNRNTY